MPRFYFNIFLGSHANLADEGYEIASLQAAEIEAMRTAGELVRDRLFTLRAACPEDIRVEAVNQQQDPVLAVTVSIRVEKFSNLEQSPQQSPSKS
jgi:hypothetical protein